MQLLVIGSPKPIHGKGLSKNKPTCKDAVSQAQHGSCTLRDYGLLEQANISGGTGSVLLDHFLLTPFIPQL